MKMNKHIDTFKKVWANIIVRNKFLLAGTAFIVWIAVFDRYNFIDRIDSLEERQKLEADKEYYIKKLEADSIAFKELNQNKEFLEKYAREKYLMKRDNEEIFIIVEEE
ncbi:MAG TPA: septum formation inhibitor [Bacteroidales bacterium]|nr:septum formation inhibitor [Bacteroidales bacterium]